MKSILISIRPKWVEKIANEKKTIEVKETKPKLETPFKCYIYETQGATETPWVDEDGHLIFKGRGQVIGEFICDKIYEYNFCGGLTRFNSTGLPYKTYGSYLIFADDYKKMCLTYDEVKAYGKGKTLYGWHISDLKIYDKPKGLNEFGNLCRMDCLRLGKGKSCEFLSTDGTPCNRIIPLTRPPQSWCYVEADE